MSFDYMWTIAEVWFWFWFVFQFVIFASIWVVSKAIQSMHDAR